MFLYVYGGVGEGVDQEGASVGCWTKLADLRFNHGLSFRGHLSTQLLIFSFYISSLSQHQLSNLLQIVV